MYSCQNKRLIDENPLSYDSNRTKQIHNTKEPQYKRTCKTLNPIRTLVQLLATLKSVTKTIRSLKNIDFLINY